MKYLQLVLLASLLYILSSCENKVEEKLEGNWKLVSMESTGFTISGQQLNNPVLSMNKNKSYSIFMDGKLTNGKWKVKGNDFFLTSGDNQEETALMIDSLTENTLIYHNKSGKADVKVFYTRMQNEEEEEEHE